MLASGTSSVQACLVQTRLGKCLLWCQRRPVAVDVSKLCLLMAGLQQFSSRAVFSALRLRGLHVCMADGGSVVAAVLCSGGTFTPAQRCSAHLIALSVVRRLQLMHGKVVRAAVANDAAERQAQLDGYTARNIEAGHGQDDEPTTLPELEAFQREVVVKLLGQHVAAPLVPQKCPAPPSSYPHALFPVHSVASLVYAAGDSATACPSVTAPARVAPSCPLGMRADMWAAARVLAQRLVQRECSARQAVLCVQRDGAGHGAARGSGAGVGAARTHTRWCVACLSRLPGSRAVVVSRFVAQWAPSSAVLESASLFENLAELDASKCLGLGAGSSGGAGGAMAPVAAAGHERRHASGGQRSGDDVDSRADGCTVFVWSSLCALSPPATAVVQDVALQLGGLFLDPGAAAEDAARPRASRRPSPPEEPVDVVDVVGADVDARSGGRVARPRPPRRGSGRGGSLRRRGARFVSASGKTYRPGMGEAVPSGMGEAVPASAPSKPPSSGVGARSGSTARGRRMPEATGGSDTDATALRAALSPVARAVAAPGTGASGTTRSGIDDSGADDQLLQLVIATPRTDPAPTRPAPSGAHTHGHAGAGAGTGTAVPQARPPSKPSGRRRFVRPGAALRPAAVPEDETLGEFDSRGLLGMVSSPPQDSSGGAYLGMGETVVATPIRRRYSADATASPAVLLGRANHSNARRAGSHEAGSPEPRAEPALPPPTTPPASAGSGVVGAAGAAAPSELGISTPASHALSAAAAAAAAADVSASTASTLNSAALAASGMTTPDAVAGGMGRGRLPAHHAPMGAGGLTTPVAGAATGTAAGVGARTPARGLPPLQGGNGTARKAHHLYTPIRGAAAAGDASSLAWGTPASTISPASSLATPSTLVLAVPATPATQRRSSTAGAAAVPSTALAAAAAAAAGEDAGLGAPVGGRPLGSLSGGGGRVPVTTSSRHGGSASYKHTPRSSRAHTTATVTGPGIRPLLLGSEGRLGSPETAAEAAARAVSAAAVQAPTQHVKAASDAAAAAALAHAHAHM